MGLCYTKSSLDSVAIHVLKTEIEKLKQPDDIKNEVDKVESNLTVEIYKQLYENLNSKYTTSININTLKFWLLSKAGINEVISNFVSRYINGDTKFVSLNRFIATLQLISMLKNGEKKLNDLQCIKQNRLKMAKFKYIQYTFMPDAQHNELSLPLTMHEIKVLENDTFDSVTQQIKQKHGIHQNELIYIYDTCYGKILREIKDFQYADDSYQDIYVYHKKTAISISSDIHTVNTFMVDVKQEYKNRTLFSLLICIDGGSIKMSDLYQELCKLIMPFLCDSYHSLLKQTMYLALNVKQYKMEFLIIGYIRLKYEKDYNLNIPQELKSLIMNYISFELESNHLLPFRFLTNERTEIYNNEEIYILPVSRNNELRFWIKCRGTWELSMPCLDFVNDIYTLDREQVESDAFDAGIPFAFKMCDIEGDFYYKDYEHSDAEGHR